jgi:ubiquinone/menaquinone biosynthesis C-methylase UbiE
VYRFLINLLSTPAALFDAVICSENNLKDIESLLKEMHRALKLGGVYLVVSHGAPDNRINHFKRYIDVRIDVVPIRECQPFPSSTLYVL